MANEVFEGVRYHIIEKNVQSPAIVSLETVMPCVYIQYFLKMTYLQVKQVFKEGGASREFYLSELVTHIISDVPVDREALSLESRDCVIVNVCHMHGSCDSTLYDNCLVVTFFAVRLGSDVI